MPCLWSSWRSEAHAYGASCPLVLSLVSRNATRAISNAPAKARFTRYQLPFSFRCIFAKHTCGNDITPNSKPRLHTNLHIRLVMHRRHNGPRDRYAETQSHREEDDDACYRRIPALHNVQGVCWFAASGHDSRDEEPVSKGRSGQASGLSEAVD
jgi:hypothetical protein